MNLTRREIERAIGENRETYPAMTECEICSEIWMSHNGNLCPICSICAAEFVYHIEHCAQCIAAQDRELGLEPCAIGIELQRKRHAINHASTPLPGRGLEEIQVREGSGVCWHLCHGGTTLFLPRLQVASSSFLN